MMTVDIPMTQETSEWSIAKLPNSSMAVFLVKCRIAPSVVSEGAEEEINGGRD